MAKRKLMIPGCAVLLVVLLIFMLSAPAALALRLAGFRSEGKLDGYLAAQAVTPRPTILWQHALATPTPLATPGMAGSIAPNVGSGQALSVPLESVKVSIWFLPQPYTFYPEQIYATRLERGKLETGRTAYFIQFDEQGINSYLSHWFGAYVEREARLRNPWLDLKAGGAVLYADVNLEVGWQRVGAVFMLDASGRQLMLAGVEMNGRLYSTPPDGQIAVLAAQLEGQANRALRELIFVDPAGSLTIQAISLGENSAQVLAY